LLFDSEVDGEGVFVRQHGGFRDREYTPRFMGESFSTAQMFPASKLAKS
jgi:hypothetical protein